MGEDVGEVVQHALVGSEALKDLDALFGVDFVGVFDSNFGDELDILSVGLEHVVHALEGVVLAKSAEELEDLVLWDGVGVEHDSLDVDHIGVVLEGSAVETDLLAHLGDLLSVILGEEVELEDTFGDVRSVDQVDLEHLSLEMALVWAVSLQGLEEECGALLDFVELEEGIDALVDVCLLWALLSVGDHLGEVDSGLWVDWHDLAQDFHEVWDVAGLLAVWHDLLELVGLNKALDDLLW